MANKRTINLATKEDVITPLTHSEEAEAAARTDAEAADMPNRVRAEIAQLERDNMMPRATREILMTLMEMNLAPQRLSGDIGYAKLKALDDQIGAKREILQRHAANLQPWTKE